MPWFDALPRTYYQGYERVPLTEDQAQHWFEVYRMDRDIYAICEPRHFQEVTSFLILGREKAVLLDTGMGIANIKILTDSLYAGEVMVVNSHFHFDHVGGNHLFQTVAMHDSPHALNQLRRGFTNAMLLTLIDDQMDEGEVWQGFPPGFDKHALEIPPSNPLLLKHGDILDLGGRRLEVLHTPGHTEDSIMLLEQESGILFTGDTFYLGALYAQFNSEHLGYSDPALYSRTLEMLCQRVPELSWLYCSHNEIVVAPGKLLECRDALKEIVEGKDRSTFSAIGLHGYEDRSATKDLVRRNYNGFSIITRR